MAEMTREQWTPAAYKIAEHLDALAKIAKELKIGGLCVGITTNDEHSNFAFYREDYEDEKVVSFEVLTNHKEIIFREGNEDYRIHKK